MQRLRADLWCAAFVRRQNDLGHICVIARRGDPVAGQVWVEMDHLNGTYSLYSPAPTVMLKNVQDWVFQRRFAQVPAEKVRERLEQEARYDPDFWVISLEMRNGDPGLDWVPD